MSTSLLVHQNKSAKETVHSWTDEARKKTIFIQQLKAEVLCTGTDARRNVESLVKNIQPVDEEITNPVVKHLEDSQRDRESHGTTLELPSNLVAACQRDLPGALKLHELEVDGVCDLLRAVYEELRFFRVKARASFTVTSTPFINTIHQPPGVTGGSVTTESKPWNGDRPQGFNEVLNPVTAVETRWTLVNKDDLGMLTTLSPSIGVVTVIQRNPPNLYKFMNSSPSMLEYPDEDPEISQYEDLDDVMARIGRGAAQDFLYIFQCKNSSEFISVGDEIELFFRRTRTSHPVTGRLLPREDPWKGFVCDRVEFPNHTGTHLLRVSRPYFGSVADTTIIPAADEWNKNDQYSAMDPRVTDTPAGRRDLGLDEAEMIYGHDDLLFNPDDEDALFTEEGCDTPPPIDFTNQKAVVVGRELSRVWFVDFFEGLSKQQIEVARSVPCGIFPIVGPGGTGKTTVVTVLLVAALERGKKPVVCSTTNAAVTNICKRSRLKNAREQLRIEPGLWNLANTLIYDNQIAMHPNSRLSEEGTVLEAWLIDVSGGYTFTEPRGTFRAFHPLVTPGKIVVLTPYLKQVSLWHEALDNYPQLDGIRVVCPESMHGWEQCFVFWDTAVAQNVKGEYSWLADRQRMCGSLTRYKSGLVIIGDSRITIRSGNVRDGSAVNAGDTEEWWLSGNG
ncbi:hypothetical protein BKA64DRAFT_740297 [Cadophora sp. MPI-SDFR-AT-0126]|nr:hypothetical protein BKA64DRAFT_740297 [Leotiomycetes sp. MPI-SDFR-AT-0126]